MPKSHPPYAVEFRQQMIELVRAGRSPAELSREFGCSAQTIINWTVQAAIDGIGVAMGRTSYVEADIAKGRLVVPFKIALPADAGDLAGRDRHVGVKDRALAGVDAQAQAIAARATKSGCTVHFVDEGLDSGPVILQREVDVRGDDDAASLSARILEQEHIAYVEALKILERRPGRRTPD